MQENRAGKGWIPPKNRGFPGKGGGLKEVFFLPFQTGRGLPSRATAPLGLQPSLPGCCTPRSHTRDGAKGMCSVRGAAGSPSSVPGACQICGFQSSARFTPKAGFPPQPRRGEREAIPSRIDSKHFLGTNNPIIKHLENKNPFASCSPLSLLAGSPWG